MVQAYYFLKFTGSALTAVSAMMFGFKLRKQLQKRKDVLIAYKSGLEFLESQIVLDELVLDECMKECGIRFFDKNSEYNIFSLFKEKLSEGQLSAEISWVESVESISAYGLLHDDEIQLLSGLSTTLGKSDIKHHSDHINEVVQKLDKLIAEADAKLKKDGSLYIKMSIAVAAVIILLLW
ncbi:MAG: stage III sporulation protein AB [Clostridia bacterium]|nr:stage III sporulation protein AB [Clostridia bacterium]